MILDDSIEEINVNYFSRRIASGHNLLRFFLGAVDFSFNPCTNFPPSSNCFFHRNKVLLLTRKVSMVALRPCFSQKARQRAL